MKVSKKSVFPTNLGRGCFQRNLFLFENESDISSSPYPISR